MKSQSSNVMSSATFCEQVSTVTTLYEKWNDCERTVVIYALLKRLRYPSLKFLLYSIESNLLQFYQDYQQQQDCGKKLEENFKNFNSCSNLSLSSGSNLSINNSSSGCSSNNSQLNINFNNNNNNIKNNDTDINNINSNKNNNNNNITNNNINDNNDNGGNINNSLPCDLYANNSNYLENLISAYKSISSAGPTADDNDDDDDDEDNNILLTTTKTADNDSNEFESATDLSCNSNIIKDNTIKKSIFTKKMYKKRENILTDVLDLLPLLKPGNEDAKQKYLSLIPVAVEDTVKDLVSTDIVQHIFSYLLIHPSISNEDRRSLSYWLKHLEEHIQSTFETNNDTNSNQPKPIQKQSSHKSKTLSSCAHNETATSNSLSSISSGSIGDKSSNDFSLNSWQTIAPPSQRHQQQQQAQSQPQTQPQPQPQQQQQQQPAVIINGVQDSVISSALTDWNINFSEITDSLCDDLQRSKLIQENSTQSQQSTFVPLIYSRDASSNSNSIDCCINLSASNDDHHVSFSKNGTEILDYDGIDCCDKCNTQIVGFNSVMLCCDHLQQQQQQQDFHNQSLLLSAAACVNPKTMLSAINLNAPRWSLDSKMAAIAMKTRRSNSLTTSALSSGSESSASSTSSVITVNDQYSNSSENLALYAQKPRSFSLSIEHTRGTLTSSGSDTRLDDFMQKQPGGNASYMKFQTHNPGMSNIGQWLKSLRLHKYIGLFTNMTYENMLEISEHFLQDLGVTKGASHKLALCIEKLKERYNNIQRLQEELLTGKSTVQSCIEELTNIVLSPMKPVDSVQPENVAWKFLQLLELVFMKVEIRDNQSQHDEECVNALLWVVERALHTEPFVAHNNQLKEYKFKLSKIKMQFSPKPHHAKNTTNGSLNKPRWNNKNRNKTTDNIMLTKGITSDRTQIRFQLHQQSLNNNSSNNNNNSINNGNNSSTISNLQNTNVNNIEKFHSTHYQTLKQYQQQHLPNSTPKLSSFGNNINSANFLSSNKTNSTTAVQQQYKSSSYPNFTTPNKNQSQFQQSQHFIQQQQQHQHQLQQQYNRQHRNSLNNLISVNQSHCMLFKPNKSFSDSQAAITPSKNNRRSSLTVSCFIQDGTNNNSNNSSNISKKPSSNGEKSLAEIITVSSGSNVSNNNDNNSTSCSINNEKLINNEVTVLNTNRTINNGGSKFTTNASNKANLNDINIEQLEFLCLQMTEQAIN